MSEPEGTGRNGVLLLGEALGLAEAQNGKPFQGRAGWALTQMLLRRDLKREDFLIENVVRCRPPDNKLNHMPYEREAIAHCSPFLDATLRERKPKVVVALGEIPMQRMLGLGKEEKITPHRGFVEWSAKYHCYVIPTFHPSFIMRGNQHLSGVFLHDVEHAVEIAREGYIPHVAVYHCDPPPQVVEALVRTYDAALAADPDHTWLAYDIETPYKLETGDEGELEIDDPSYQILRISFSWKAGEALSVPWQAQYLPYIQHLLGSEGIKLVHNGRYDIPRLIANGIALRGEQWDTMWAWHVINSDLPKGLDFVATFLARGQGRWKHLSREQPARYNAIDAEVTRRIGGRLHEDLHRHHLWEVFHRHIVELDVILERMSQAGVCLDDQARRALSSDLTERLRATVTRMQTVVPLAGKRLRKYKGKPKGVNWVLGDPVPAGFTVISGAEDAPFCSLCGEANPKKPHFRVLKKRVNPCASGTVVYKQVDVGRLARIETFVPSNSQMLAYATACGHTPRTTKGKPGEGPRITFDETAIKDLLRTHKDDPLYPLVLEHREVEKLLSTYVGTWDEVEGRWISGPPIGPDGRVHTQYTHAPSTLRLSSRSPNLQNIPRGDDSELARAIKRLYIPEAGHALCEVDYAAIEARLLAYFANSPTYDRLARLGVHDYVNSHILHRDGRIGEAANLAWSDADLRACFKDLKARFDHERNVSKRIVYLSNYGGTPKRIHDAYPELFGSIKDAARLQAIYWEVCPDIRRWQQATVKQADDSGYLVNPFGYLHRFWQVQEWKKTRDGWEAVWGEDAKRVLAYLPQSTAAGIIKEAMLAINEDTPYGEALRLQVHDSLVCSAPLPVYNHMVEDVIRMMTRPIPQLWLPWDPAQCMVIDVEAKVGGEGTSWGDLRKAA